MHEPWTHDGEQVNTSHIAPDQPLSQLHVLGPVHEPWTHDGEQVNTSHIAPVQPLSQLHVLGAVHDPCTHDGEHIGVVHVGPVHPTLQVQRPSAQVAFVPQEIVLLVFTHPVSESQESSVQTLPSLQSLGGPPIQEPPEQASSVVHAFSSSQGSVLLV